MDGAALLRDILLVGGGAVALKLLDMVRDALSAPGRARRREVDLLAAELKERDLKLAGVIEQLESARTRYRLVVEAFHGLRVWVLRTGLHDPADVPDFDLEGR